MKWYVKVFDHVDASLAFINRHNMAPEAFKICAYHLTSGVEVFLIYYLAERPLE